jgi:hypothetical protein
MTLAPLTQTQNIPPSAPGQSSPLVLPLQPHDATSTKKITHVGPDAHEVASSMNRARKQVEPVALPETSVSQDAADAATSVTDKYAFAFDIDGVLVRGGQAIPEAVEAMRVLNGANKVSPIIERQCWSSD